MGNNKSINTKKQSGSRNDINFGAMEFHYNAKIQISEEYKVKSPPLGMGPMGELREVYYKKLNQKRLIKIIYKYNLDDADIDKINEELEMLKDMSHPNIMKIYETSEDKLYIYIIMEFFQGRMLFDRIREGRPLTETHSIKILKMLVSVLKYLHSKNIAYRDLKLENILYNGSDIKIMDFSSAKRVIGNKKFSDIVGSPYYIAPEILKGKYDKRCDIWSFGIIAYTLVNGRTPFKGQNTGEILDNVIKEEIEYPISFTPEYVDFLREVLVKKPNKRASLDDILKCEVFENSLAFEQKRIANQFTEILYNMRNFRYQNPFQLAIYLFLFNNVIERNLIRDVDEVYRMIDKKSDGFITRQQIIKFCRDFNIELVVKDLDVILKKLSFEDGDSLTYNEFLAGSFNQRELLSEDNITKCFKIFDSDNSGSISLEEFEDLFPNVDKNIIEPFLIEFDVNGDGDIDLSEFKAILLNMIRAQTIR